MSVAAKMRGNTASMTRKHKFLGGYRGNLCVEEFRSDSTPPVREKRISGYERYERDYKRLQRAQVAFPVRPAHLSRRSPGEMSVRGPIVA